MNPIEIVKKHPVATGIGALVVIGGVILLSSGGGGQVSAEQAATDSSVAAGLQLQQLQIQAGAQAAQVGAQREIALAQTAAELELGKLALSQQGASDQLAASLGLAQINATQQTTSLVSTLQSQVQMADIQAETARNAAMLATITEQSRQSSQVALAGINAQVKVAEINKPRGLLSAIFG